MVQYRKNLLGIKNIEKKDLYYFLDSAPGFLEVSEREIKKVPSLRGKTVINLFLEPSTRTRASFEIAGKRLSADTINLSGSTSSVVKGETLLDTARTLESMSPDILVIRHSESGAADLIARFLKNCSIVNAGDGENEHPTQALLDLLSLRLALKRQGREIEGLRVSIVGDVRHSRVARSHIWAHKLLGNKVRLVGPSSLVPAEFSKAFGFPVEISHNLREGVEAADVVLCLRLQKERAAASFIPSVDEYSRKYCVSEKVISRHCPQALVLHPGPVNRGVEVSSDLIDGPRSLMRDQVTKGVAIRMAVLFVLGVTAGKEQNQAEEAHQEVVL
jgi:aspartate carbamoyltransferase catalytic subunit